MPTVELTVNGKRASAQVEGRTLLVQLLREKLGLTGTHIGCDTSQCGACVVHVDGRAVKSCTMLAVQANGAAVTTIEGLANGETLHPIQQAFTEGHGLQCGFCTPGMMLVGAALLEAGDELSDEDVRWAIAGNLCRCTGYMNIVESIRAASEAASVTGGVG